jgi:pimeloyl-ACP methyl ester carboxylesterase
MGDDLVPFRIDVDDAALDDLRDRLARTRWPNAETVDDWSQGVPLAYLQELCRYWERDYDWRRAERRLNELPQFRTELDGLAIHFIHVRSLRDDALPLVLTHGWPGSVLEFEKAIGPLTDTFHVVCPALPGFGFSDKPAETSWGVERIARAWARLMARLGYERYVAQGGDWGAAVTTALARHDGDHVAGIHLNYATLSPDKLLALGDLTADEEGALAALRAHRTDGAGYSMQQATRPQTVGYALADSPAGQCAWIVEKFAKWSDCGQNPENAFTRDEMLDNVTLYWLTDTAASSARLYWESQASVRASSEPLEVPASFSAFPAEIVCFPERWVKTKYANLRYYHRVERGGHFAAFEVPELFVREVRSALGQL